MTLMPTDVRSPYTRSMKPGLRVLAFACCAVLVLGCESPDEKPAQEALTHAKIDLRVNSPDQYLAFGYVATKYPKTKAGKEASKLADELLAARHKKAQLVAARLVQARGALTRLNSEHDEFKKITWYSDPATSKYVFGTWMKLYFGVSEKEEPASLYPLRMKLQLNLPIWVFAHTASLKIRDAVFSVTPKDWDRDTGGGSVRETCDVPISSTNPELLHALAGADAVTVRFEGQKGYFDFAVPREQIDAAKRILAVWHAIDSGESATL